MRIQFLRQVPFALFLVAVVLAAGCGGRPFAEVEGTITLDGKPLPDAEVTFLPDSLAGNPGNNATGTTNEEGHYRVRSARDKKDGTILGVHRVVVVDLRSVPNIEPGGGSAPGEAAGQQKAKRAEQPRFPLEYADPLRTPLVGVDVKAGKQTFNFDLKSSRPAGKAK